MNEREIFIKVLEKADRAERSAFLDAACGQDAELREQVEELLAAHEKDDSFFLDSPPPGIDATTDQPIAEGPGTVIGPYRLMEQIGEGGMGVVYVAEQQEPVRRKVALKIIKPGMDTREVVARFQAERQALALMDHANIARVLEAGATESERPYFVMELVRGVPITDYCDEANLTTRQRLELFVSVCQAIQHAHQKGIIHRDVKPSNVLVTLRDGTPVPKVIDFGVAKAINQRLTERTVYTRFAQMVGTPLYMSPEQATMSERDVDTRTDVYSLGVLLYELLVGSTPFHPEQLREAGYDEICRIIRENDPPTPSRRLSALGEAATTEVSGHRQAQPATLRRLLRGDLDWIVMKALEKDRNRRYETANDFAADVERYLNDEAVEARHPSAAYTFGKFARRNRSMLTTVALVAAALVVGTVVSVWLAVNATIERSKAEDASQREFAARRRAEDLRYVSDMNRAEQALRDRDWRLVRRLLREHHPSADGTDRRGWEWYYLWRACRDYDTVPTFHHKDWVSSIAISPDGGTLVSGDMAGNLNLWDVADRKQLSSTKAHRAWVWDVELSPDGRLVSCGGDRFIRLWRIDPGTHTLVGEGALEVPRYTWRLALSNDGNFLAASDREWKIRLWDLSTQEIVAQIPGPAVALAFRPDGQALAAHHGDKVTIWRLPYDSDQPHWEITGFDSISTWTALAFSPDGSSIATSWRRNGVKLWSVADRKPIHHLEVPTRALSVAFSRDGKTIAIGDEEKTVSTWDTTTGERLENFSHSSSVCCVRFTPDGKKVASSSKDTTVRLWDLNRGRPRDVLDHQSIGVGSLSFSADGKWLATSDSAFSIAIGQKVILWDPETWDKVKEFPGWTFAFSRDSRYLALDGETDEEDGIVTPVHVWDLRARQVVDTMLRRDLVGFLPNGQLAMRDRDRPTLELWDSSDRKIVGRCEAPDSASELWRTAMAFAFSPDGRTLAVSTGLGDVALLDAKTLDILQHQPNALSYRGPSVVFSPDGDYLVTPDGSHSLKVWDVRNGKLELIDTLPDHAAGCVCATFSPDGFLAVGCDNGTVTFWDTSTWTERATIKCHERVLDAICFSPDGSMMVTSGPEGTVRIHRAATLEDVIEAERTGDDPLGVD